SEKWLKELIRFHRMYLSSDEFNDLHDISHIHLKTTYRSLVRFYGRNFAPAKALKTFQESLSLGFDTMTMVYAVASLLGPTLFIIGSKFQRLKSSKLKA